MANYYPYADDNRGRSVFTSGGSGTEAENSPTTNIVYVAHAQVNRHPHRQLFYRLDANVADNNYFSINATTGAVTFNTSPDFEGAHGNTYSILVTAYDGRPRHTVQRAVTITVTDVNDNAPVFTTGTSATTTENVSTTTAVYTAHAIDADGTSPNNTVHYSLAANVGDNNLFNINVTTGAVTFKAPPDFEHPTDIGANNIYDVTVTATDGGTPAKATTQMVHITVTDVNEAPTITSAASASEAENTPASTVVYTAHATDPDTTAPNNTLKYSLSGADATVFTVDPTTGEVRFNTSPDYEAPTDRNHVNAYHITVTATDGGSPALSGSKDVTINVTNVNEPPTATNESLSTNENIALTIKPSDLLGNDTDPEHDMLTVTNTSQPHDGTLMPDGNGNYIYTPNANYYGTDTFTYQASDGQNLSNVATVTINVPHVNQPPVANSDQYTTNEDTSLTIPTKGVLTNDTDADNDPLTAVLATGPNHGNLTLNPDGSFTYTPFADYNGTDQFTYKANDGTANSAPTTVDLTINAVNDPPVNHVPGPQTVYENGSLAFNTGNGNAVSVTDVDANGGQETITLTAAHGTINNSLVYEVIGSLSSINGFLQNIFYRPNANYNGPDTITITTNDQGNTGSGGAQTAGGHIDITVAPINHAPSGADKTVTTLEDTAYTFAASDFGFSDPDGNTLAAVKIHTLPTAGSLTDNGTAVTADQAVSVADVTAGSLKFTPAPDANGTGYANFTFQVQDNGGTAGSGQDTDQSPKTITIDVTPVNDAPSFTLASTSTISNEDAGVQTVTGLAANISPGPPNESSQTVSFVVDTNTNAALFAAGGGPAIDSSGNLTYTAAANANGSATITFHAMDTGGTDHGGVDHSADQTFTINVTPVNDPPTLTATGKNPTYAMGGVDLFSTVMATTGPSDESAQQLDRLVLTVTNLSGLGESLTVDGTSVALTAGTSATSSNLGVTASVALSGTTATVTITKSGGISAAQMATLVDGLTYTDTSVSGSDPSVVVTLTQLHDTGGTDHSGNDTATLAISSTVSFNQPPVVTTSGGTTLSYIENQAATSIDSQVMVSDANDTTLAGATVQITSGYAGSQDILAFTQVGNINGSYSNGLLTLSGTDTLAHYTQALDSVTYYNSSDNPSTTDRTVSFIANDGKANSNMATDTIHVTAVNDAPVVNATGTTAYTENDPATKIAPAASVSDVDSSSLTGATVTITNYVAGQDVLGFTNQNNITGTVNGGTLTLSGTDTLAHYQTALESVTYANTSDNPSTTARSVTFQVNDGATQNNLSATSTHTITVTAVDDAPVAVADGSSASPIAVSSGVQPTYNLLDNDTDVDTAHGSLTAIKDTNGAHGTVTVNPNGTFIYNVTGNYVGTDTFTYHAFDGLLPSNTVTVTVNVQPSIAYIDNSRTTANSTQDGTAANPYVSIAAFNTANPSHNFQTVYIEKGTGSYAVPSGGITLLANQVLEGQGVDPTYVDGNGVTHVAQDFNNSAGNIPTLTFTGTGHAITLASGNTVAGFTLAGSNMLGQMGIYGSGVAGVTLDHLTVQNFGTTNNHVDGSTAARTTDADVSLSNVTGAVSVTNSTFTNTTSNAYTKEGGQDAFILNNSGGTATLTATGNTFSNGHADNGSDTFVSGLAVYTSGTANITANVKGNTFSNLDRGFEGDASGGSTLNANINGTSGSAATTGNTFTSTNGQTNNGGSIFLTSHNTANLDYNITNNAKLYSNNANNYTISISAQDSSLTQGRLDDNPDIQGQVYFETLGAGKQVFEILRNSLMDQSTAPIIYVNSAGTGSIDTTIANNTISMPGAYNFEKAIFLSVGATGSTDTDNIYADLHNNNVTLGPGTKAAIVYRDNFSTPTIYVKGLQTDAYQAWNSNGNTPTASSSNTVVVLLSADKPQALPANHSSVASPINAAAPLLYESGGVAAAATGHDAHGVEAQITQADLNAVVNVAIHDWALAGASAAQLAELRTATYDVASLSGERLGQTYDNHVQIDATASGHGWYVDPTPNDSFEFAHASVSGTNLLSSPTQAPAGSVDLLTTVLHEMGHIIGLPDNPNASAQDDLMYLYLGTGQRRLPSATDVAEAKAAQPAASTPQATVTQATAHTGTDTIEFAKSSSGANGSPAAVSHHQDIFLQSAGGDYSDPGRPHWQDIGHADQVMHTTFGDVSPHAHEKAGPHVDHLI